MSKLPAQQRPRSFFPELSELFEGFPSWATLRPAFGSHVIRVEDEMKDGNYEIRAEIPGVDPGKDVDITVRDGLLTIKAERTEKKADDWAKKLREWSGKHDGAEVLARLDAKMGAACAKGGCKDVLKA